MKEVFNPELAAGSFLSNVVRYINIIWDSPDIKKLEEILNIDITSDDNEWAYFYFLAAYIAVANQSLEVHFKKSEADILKNELYKRINSCEMTLKEELIIAIKLFDEVIRDFPNYQNNFPISLEFGPPIFANVSEAIGIAYAESADIDLSYTSSFNNMRSYNLLSGCMIGDFIFLLCTKMHWGTLLEEYDIDFN